MSRHGEYAAFPCDSRESGEFSGLTKRELFAAMAMQGFCAADDAEGVPDDMIAQWSVEHADALIAALNESEGAS